MLVLHTTELSFEQSLYALTNKKTEKPVSVHYLIGDHDYIYRLVDEHKRAWHAGISYWQGDTDINNRSIGIELCYTKGKEFAAKQVALLVELASDIIKRYKIKSYNVVGHSDIAFLRKSDPGLHFPWQALAKKGIGSKADKVEITDTPGEILWGKDPLYAESVKILLSSYGYDTKKNAVEALAAFELHFCNDILRQKKIPNVTKTLVELIEKHTDIQKNAEVNNAIKYLKSL